MPVEDLSKAIDCPSNIFQQLTEALASQGYQITAKGIAHSDHTLTLPDEIKHVAKSTLDRLNRDGLNPPNKADLTTTTATSKAMRFLITSGQVIELDPKVVISTTSRDAAAESVRSFISNHPHAPTGASGSHRRYH